MRRHSAYLFVMFVFLTLSGVGQATAAVPGLELTRLLINPASPQIDAQDEFVELHNASPSAIVLSGYSLRVGSKTYSLPAQTVAAGKSLTLTAASSPWALGNDGGTIALINASGTTLESTTWSKASPGTLWEKQTSGTWSWATTNPAASPSMNPRPTLGVATSPLQITELLPDPASPLTDANDEFKELYNSGDLPITLTGYVIKTGAGLSAKHTLSDTTIAPGDYRALTSGSTRIALANAGSSIALFDTAGHQIGETITYSKASPGFAWASHDGAWTWTTTPTAGTANIITAPPLPIASEKTTPASSITKTTKAKTTNIATKTPKATKATTKITNPPLTAAASTAGGQWLLFGLVGLTIAYIIYEFRHDIRNFYLRLRGHTGLRRPLSETLKGWRNHRAQQRSGWGKDDLRARLAARPWLRRRSHESDLHAQSGLSGTPGA